MKKTLGSVLTLLAIASAISLTFHPGSRRTAAEDIPPQPLPIGQVITPLAAPGAVFEPLVEGDPWLGAGAAAIAVSPDGNEMLVFAAASRPAAVYLYDITGDRPRLKQSLKATFGFHGLAWAADGQKFYVTGSEEYSTDPAAQEQAKDKILVFARGPQEFAADGEPINLGHAHGNGHKGIDPAAAGIAVSPGGDRLLVANFNNDSVSLIDLASRKVAGELDLRPGKINPSQQGKAGGEAPFSVVWRDDEHAYVSAARDREIVALNIKGANIAVTKRIPTTGVPTVLLLNKNRTRLYATEDNDDRLLVVDTARDAALQEPPLSLPDSLGGASLGKGTNPNGMAFLPGEGSLLVTYGGINALAFVDLKGPTPKVAALVPTGWYPTAVALRNDAKRVFVVNLKAVEGPTKRSADLGPYGGPSPDPSVADLHFDEPKQLGLLSFNLPDAPALAHLTRQVGKNVGMRSHAEQAQAEAVMAALHQRIKHVVFIIKENKTYDAVMGDLEIGNGIPKLAVLGERLSPNQHQLARQFMNFDNFYVCGEWSQMGWSWSTAARATDMLIREGFENGGTTFDSEGRLREVSLEANAPARHKFDPDSPGDPDLLPGERHTTSPDGPGDHMEGKGFLWDAALRAGLTVRNYGMFSDPNITDKAPKDREPFKEKTVVFHATTPSLQAHSDPYYRGFDQDVPEFWRLNEWKREFTQQVKDNSFPTLTLLRMGADHFGAKKDALDRVNTVETQMADNDFATGDLVETIAKSPYHDSTLIFIIEDDPGGLADHVDSMRSFAFIVGPYTRRHALVSTRYTTINFLRTIGAVLGLKPLGLYDTLALPMADAFDLKQKDWTFESKPSSVLLTTGLPLSAEKRAAAVGPSCPLRSADYWAKAFRGMDFEDADDAPEGAYAKAIWFGLGPGGAPPAPDRQDYRANRAELLKSVPRCPAL